MLKQCQLDFLNQIPHIGNSDEDGLILISFKSQCKNRKDEFYICVCEKSGENNIETKTKLKNELFKKCSECKNAHMYE